MPDVVGGNDQKKREIQEEHKRSAQNRGQKQLSLFSPLCGAVWSSVCGVAVSVGVCISSWDVAATLGACMPRYQQLEMLGSRG